MNSIFWFGLALGFIANLVASHYWDLLTRYRLWKTARTLAGTWVAYSVHGRVVDTTPMPGAGLTEVHAKTHWFGANAAVLDVKSYDITPDGGRRDHDGYIVLDPAVPWLATRIDRYADSNEVAEQRLVIGPDSNIVYVFPVPGLSTLGDVYGKHAWRRKHADPDPTTPRVR